MPLAQPVTALVECIFPIIYGEFAPGSQRLDFLETLSVAANKLFLMSWIAAVPAGFMVFFAIMGIISDAKTSLKAVMAIGAIVGACLAAAPIAFLIFSGKKKKKAAPAAAAAAAAPAAAAAAPSDSEQIEAVEEVSGEADVFEEADSADDLGFEDLEESDEEK
jgi:hypothetical protein